MNRYEQRVQFERLCSLRDAYRAASPDERRAVVTIAEAIEQAEAMMLELAAISEPAANPEDHPDQQIPPREG